MNIEFYVYLQQSQLFFKSETHHDLGLGASALYDRGTPTENEKLRIAMNAYGISVYYA